MLIALFYNIGNNIFNIYSDCTAKVVPILPDESGSNPLKGTEILSFQYEVCFEKWCVLHLYGLHEKKIFVVRLIKYSVLL